MISFSERLGFTLHEPLPDRVQKPFFAKFDETATWLDGLTPPLGAEAFFYEAEYQEMQKARGV